jgi:hypothetical protein
MASVEHLLASCGVGAANLTLYLEESAHPRGSNIHGTLRLQGGKVGQHIERLNIGLCHFGAISNAGGVAMREEILSSATIAQDIDVLPGSVQDYDFAVEIPDHVYITCRPYSFNQNHQGGRVVAEADIRWAVNPRAAVELNVVAHREVFAVWQAMETLGFTEREGGKVREYPSATIVNFLTGTEGLKNALEKWYCPPEPLAAELGAVGLCLAVRDGEVIGRAMLSRRASDLQGHLLSFLIADIRDLDFRIRCSDLRDRLGNPLQDRAIAVLREMLDGELLLPGSEHRWLLRGSETPKSASDDLLRPAENGAATPGSELLLPIDHEYEQGEAQR